ncbi:TlpA family protein disulfide reductase [Polaribacter sargassicola]|uniref:TlpA family protein disulfide reductase n=1 Tax=Polaribacter sargassicola TaxID=2836891 RepID=UPI001F18785C|nr:TlpA disulfide reductase family protein [Polaribacter sp. DS7-9]MCG1035170.1 TlpA family protein disulfide reductase [Polaribacter sp. DS7-9]
MKKILALIFFISSFANAQYTINGTMSNAIESDWVILYKIEGSSQKYIQDSKIKTSIVDVQGKKQEIGTFNFTLPKDTEPGAYRITYKLENAGFVDFIFNKENLNFSFHPDYPYQTVTFSTSKENILYKKYLEKISNAQEKLDSIQITALQNPNLDLKKDYKVAYNNVNTIQNEYLLSSKGMYIAPFIKASLRNNPEEILDNPQTYMSNIINTFFDKIDFNNKTLLNSYFLVDKITDYVFYINYSDDPNTQQILYKKSVDKVISKFENPIYKKNTIEFLINQFETIMNLELIDYLFENHYSKLPKTIQNQKFITSKQSLFATEVGRIAPDFSWKENDKNFKLSTLNDSEKYVLVFWSTTCSHCLNEIPKLYNFLKENKAVKVIAFALEDDKFGWENYKTSLPNWHNVLGLNKWENKIARTYNIISTPTYFILDKNKKIIAKPESLEDVKSFLNK